MKPLQDCHRTFQRTHKIFYQDLNESAQNSHRATARAIWPIQSAERVARAIAEFAPQRERLTHAQSHERVAGAHITDFHKPCAHHEKLTLKKSKKTGLSHFFVEVYRVMRMPRKMSLRHPKCCTWHTDNHHHVQNQIRRQFHFSPIFDPFKTSSKFTHKLTSKSTSRFDPRLPTF
jgi:hypothetical protein